MDSLKKIYKKIVKDLKVFDKNFNYVISKSNTFSFILFWDIIGCRIRYGITSNEYRIFEFYNLSNNKRKTFMSKRKYEHIRNKLVNKNLTNTLNSKERFNSRFKDYLKREVNNINKMSFKQIENFILENKTIIGKSLSASFISSYKQYDLKDYRSPAFLAKDIQDNKDYLLEKPFNQHKELNKIAPMVFVNVVTVYNDTPDVVSATIKFRDEDTISGYIDIKNKCLKGHLKNEKGKNYSDEFDGFEIPKFKSTIEIAKKLCEELSEVRQVEWSFIIGSKDIYLVDANIWDDYVFCQMREFLDNDEGLMTYYKNI